MLNKVKEIKNYKINCLDGEIGKVKDFYFEDQNWTVKYLIVNMGNWLIGRQVLISPRSIVSVNKEVETISVNLSKEQVENSPLLESDKPVSLQYQEQFYGYYQYPLYATGMQDGSTLNVIPIETEKELILQKAEEARDWDPNLRSINVVNGYTIQALDNRLGHVDDFIIDIDSWKIRYLLIDTKVWLPGRKILIAPGWIDHVSWDESKVFVKLTTDEIKASPDFSEEAILNRDYETKMYEHYKRDAYWNVR